MCWCKNLVLWISKNHLNVPEKIVKRHKIHFCLPLNFTFILLEFKLKTPNFENELYMTYYEKANVTIEVCLKEKSLSQDGKKMESIYQYYAYWILQALDMKKFN